MKQLFTTSCLTVAMLTCTGNANANALNYSEYEQLFGEPVTTGATGTPQRVSDVPLDMTIITQAEIKRAAARDIPDVLRQVPGVHVRRNGPGWADVSIRGYGQGDSDRVLVLLNGRQVYMEDYGYVDWNSIPVQLEEIQQIEVIRGPNTALYGFNAASGVINIITKNPLYTQGGSANLSYGDHGYRHGGVNAQQKLSDKAAVAVSLSGGMSHEGKLAKSGFLGTLDHIDPEQYAARVDGHYQLDENSQFGLSVANSMSDKNDHTVRDVTNKLMLRTQAFTADYNTEGSLGLFSLKASHAEINKEVTQALRGMNYGTTEVNANDVFKLGTDHTLRVGLGMKYVEGDITSNIPSNGQFSYMIPNASAAWTWQFADAWSWTNALRYDRFISNRTGTLALGPFTAAEYDRNIGDYSGNSGLVFKATENDTLRLSIARGVKLPSMNNLDLQAFAGGPNYGVGNPYLPISITRDAQLGWDHHFADLGLITKASVFYQRTSDIANFADGIGTNVYRASLNTEAMGGELGVDGTFLDHWRYGASYSLAEVNDESSTAGDGVYYSKTSPNHMIKGNLGWADGDWAIDSFVSYNSRYKTQGSSPRTVNGVWQWDAKASYQITPQFSTAFTVIGALDNSWNETGSTSLENQRSAILSAEYKF